MEHGTSKRSRFRASPLLVLTLCLGIPVGFSMGYMNRASQIREAKKAADAAGADQGGTPVGPCKTWAATICEQMGDLAHECKTAMETSLLLSGSACAQAQANVLAKIDSLTAERVTCSELTSKLCDDLGPEAKGCELVRSAEPTFSVKKCQNITNNYHQALAQIIEQQEKGTLPQPPRQSKSASISKPN